MDIKWTGILGREVEWTLHKYNKNACVKLPLRSIIITINPLIEYK